MFWRVNFVYASVIDTGTKEYKKSGRKSRAFKRNVPQWRTLFFQLWLHLAYSTASSLSSLWEDFPALTALQEDRHHVTLFLVSSEVFLFFNIHRFWNAFLLSQCTWLLCCSFRFLFRHFPLSSFFASPISNLHCDFSLLVTNMHFVYLQLILKTFFSVSFITF